MIGCTTPFGYNLNNICTETNESKRAGQLFDELQRKQEEIEECQYPCNFLKVLVSPLKIRSESTLNNAIVLFFAKYIKVSIFDYSYTELELLAELGGYVGLFLGLSVFDFRQVIHKILNY